MLLAMPVRWKVLLLVSCLAAQHAVAADRQWYSLTIDGNRVGYAWHDHDPQAGTDAEVMRLEVEQLRKRVSVECNIGGIGGPRHYCCQAKMANHNPLLRQQSAGPSPK